MVKRILAIVLIVLGLAVAAGGVLSATQWRTSDTVTAQLPETPEAPVLVVEPGVLDVVDPQVTIHATAADPEARVVLVIARDDDVAAWVGDASHVSVTGLSDWTTLAATTVEGEEQEVPDPAVSDMWYLVEEGTGEATITWEVPEGRWVLLAATDGTAPAPAIDLTWPQEVATPYLIPALAAGGALVLIGLAWLVFLLLRGRARRRTPASPEPASTLVATLPVPGSAEGDGSEGTAPGPAGVDAMTDTAVTRRQLREEAARVAAAEAASRRRRGRRRDHEEPAEDATTVLPATPDAIESPDATTEALDLATAAPEAADAPSAYPAWLQAGGAESQADGESPADAPVAFEAPEAEPAAEPGSSEEATSSDKRRGRRSFLRRRPKNDATAADAEEDEAGTSGRSWDPATWAAPAIGAGAAPAAPAVPDSVTDEAPAQDDAEPAAVDAPGDDALEENGRASEWRRAWGLRAGSESGAETDAGGAPERADDEPDEEGTR
ncbi:hypothetical protein [Beutenbergia cavernae]|uniref:hypothetical protein n=1 Tax=Beutenbergia cavernae TaxID=84757 RepID=UPI000303B6AC|nr:hypothetical protein [Beutenbergia cavernae]